jgi:hypothetical protein
MMKKLLFLALFAPVLLLSCDNKVSGDKETKINFPIDTTSHYDTLINPPLSNKAYLVRKGGGDTVAILENGVALKKYHKS